jgi:hypothetical protein
LYQSTVPIDSVIGAMDISNHNIKGIAGMPGVGAAVMEERG